MMDTYTPSQAVAWIATRNVEWAALSDTERGARALYTSHGTTPEAKHDGAADGLLSALREGRIIATDAAGDVLPKTKWNAVDAEHLRRARNVPAHLPWLHGVRFSAARVRKVWPVDPMPTRVTKDVRPEVRIAWLRERLQRAEQDGTIPDADAIQEECCAALGCSRDAAREAWAALPYGGAKRGRGRPKRESARPGNTREI